MGQRGTHTVEALVATSPGDENQAIESLQDWSSFCEHLRATLAKTGSSQRDLERRAARKGLSLPRSTLSRMLAGNGRPSRGPLENLLQVLNLPDETRQSWVQAWERISVARSEPSVRASSSRPAVEDHPSTIPEDVVYEAVFDIVEIARTMASRAVDQHRADIIDRARQELTATHEKYAEAERAKDEIIAKAERRAEIILDNARRTSKQMQDDARKRCEQMLNDAQSRSSLILEEATEVQRSAAANYESIVADAFEQFRQVFHEIDQELVAQGMPELDPEVKYREFLARIRSIIKSQYVGPPSNSAAVQDGKDAQREKRRQTPTPDLKVGDRVHHKKYGHGTVESVDEHSAKAPTVIIDFGANGTARLALRPDIPLEKMSPE
jgi:hypothetical protein